MEIDYSVVTEEVSTSTILCNEGDCLVTIDLDLTTKSDAEKAVMSKVMLRKLLRKL